MEEKYIPVCKGGGIFHSKKVQYSKETHRLVKRLLEESKLSIVQRKKLENVVQNGDPLPKPKAKEVISPLQASSVTKAKSTKKRSMSTILQSGAYERERYSPINNSEAYEKDKARLQSLMAYGKDIKICPNKGSAEQDKRRKTIVVPSCKETTKNEMFEELIMEIEEREKFLEDMEILGEKNYKDIIENEISSKMRQMEMLDKERYNKETGIVERFRKKYKKLSEVSTFPIN